MKYKIIETTNPNGISEWEARDENDHYVGGSVSIVSAEECERALRASLKTNERVVKEIEL